MKVIFLDIDGVLATSFKRIENEFGSIYPFSKGAVKQLNYILEQTHAKIVLSSTWRLLYDIETMKKIFEWNECIDYPIDYTVIYHSDSLNIVIARERVDEIKEYVERNKDTIEKWVAIDDENLDRLGREHFVRCGQRQGLAEDKKAKEVIRRLT